MPEHKERNNKNEPWESVMWRTCRECLHPKYMHLLELTDTHYTLGACNEIIQGGFCFCQEYLPQDNLDYIELLAEKKGLIPEDGKDR